MQAAALTPSSLQVENVVRLAEVGSVFKSYIQVITTRFDGIFLSGCAACSSLRYILTVK